jgi:hypothetical protein
MLGGDWCLDVKVPRGYQQLPTMASRRYTCMLHMCTGHVGE